MANFFALLLWAATILAVVAGMPQLGIAICIIILVNGVFAFVQEHRAERAAERLRDLMPTAWDTQPARVQSPGLWRPSKGVTA